jgi:hypothetical protein
VSNVPALQHGRDPLDGDGGGWKQERTPSVELVLAHSGKKVGLPKGGSPLPPRPEKPGWADGLRQLYDSVLDEQLPDSFDDLLKKLDQAGHG